MNIPEDNICARDGCGFHVALVMVADMAMPGRWCGEACADYEWLRRGLAAMEPTAETAALYGNLRGVADVLDARTDPTQVGPLVGGDAG
ncbi:hypothetical protein [Streptomyces sp. NPDC048411]|uniref:hypothetical protein n=1 Tax=Streptomyces sp. NPDC048411 TaxID=3157206 RepID=UPI003453943D